MSVPQPEEGRGRQRYKPQTLPTPPQCKCRTLLWWTWWDRAKGHRWHSADQWKWNTAEIRRSSRRVCPERCAACRSHLQNTSRYNTLSPRRRSARARERSRGLVGLCRALKWEMTWRQAASPAPWSVCPRHKPDKWPAEPQRGVRSCSRSCSPRSTRRQASPSRHWEPGLSSHQACPGPTVYPGSVTSLEKDSPSSRGAKSLTWKKGYKKAG